MFGGSAKEASMVPKIPFSGTLLKKAKVLLYSFQKVMLWI